MADWPSSLPQTPLIDGYSESKGEGRRMSKTDTGPGKVFRRSTAVSRAVNASMYMTADQLTDFDDFYENELDGGALPFFFPNVRDPLIPLLVRFRTDAVPEWSSPDGTLWKVSIPLEILP